MAADENLTTSRILNKLAHDISTKAATITTASDDSLLVYDTSVGKVGKVAISALTLTDLTAVTNAVTVGEDGTGYDVTFFGATAGQKVFWDESADTLFLPATIDVDGTITNGVDGTGYDVKFFSATSGKSWLWDESADKMIVTGASDLLGTTQQTGTFTVGVDATGHDVKFFGDTTGKSFLWDESLDKLVVTGDVKIDGKLTKSQGVPTAKTVTAAISAAELVGGLITTTGATGPSIHQLPTGTLIDAELPGVATGDSFDFYIINTGTGASTDATITVNTDVTIIGNPTVGSLTDETIISGSGHFRARRSAANTYVIYRLA